jgi:thiamine biosynthesis lipoprotein
MGTDVLLIARHGGETVSLDDAADVFPRLETRMSRFLPDSELSMLNRSAGSRVDVSAELFEVLELALEMNRRTGGLFEPGVLGALEAAGYDRSFEFVKGVSRPDVISEPPQPRSISEIELDPARRRVVMPFGVRLDLGGIGKGFAVDSAARVLAPIGNFLVDAGGDIFASGDGAGGDGWQVAISGPPPASIDIAFLRLRDEALATSTTAVRRWRQDGRWRNHLIDPRTGRPTESDAVSASVIAPTTLEAEVLAKVALLLGRDGGISFLEREARAGLLVLDDGALACSTMWNQRQAKEVAKGERGEAA